MDTNKIAFDSYVITQINELMIKLMPNTDALEELYNNPWDPEFSLEDCWVESMNMDYDEYEKIREEVCEFALRYYRQKYYGWFLDFSEN